MAHDRCAVKYSQRMTGTRSYSWWNCQHPPKWMNAWIQTGPGLGLAETVLDVRRCWSPTVSLWRVQVGSDPSLSSISTDTYSRQHPRQQPVSQPSAHKSCWGRAEAHTTCPWETFFSSPKVTGRKQENLDLKQAPASILSKHYAVSLCSSSSRTHLVIVACAAPGWVDISHPEKKAAALGLPVAVVLGNLFALKQQRSSSKRRVTGSRTDAASPPLFQTLVCALLKKSQGQVFTQKTQGGAGNDAFPVMSRALFWIFFRFRDVELTVGIACISGVHHDVSHTSRAAHHEQVHRHTHRLMQSHFLCSFLYGDNT